MNNHIPGRREQTIDQICFFSDNSQKGRTYRKIVHGLVPSLPELTPSDFHFLAGGKSILMNRHSFLFPQSELTL